MLRFKGSPSATKRPLGTPQPLGGLLAHRGSATWTPWITATLGWSSTTSPRRREPLAGLLLRPVTFPSNACFCSTKVVHQRGKRSTGTNSTPTLLNRSLRCCKTVPPHPASISLSPPKAFPSESAVATTKQVLTKNSPCLVAVTTVQSATTDGSIMVTARSQGKQWNHFLVPNTGFFSSLD